MALQLSLKPKNPKSLTNPSLIHLFSSNSSAPSDSNYDTADTSTDSAYSSMSAFDVKGYLKQQQPSSSSPTPRRSSYSFTSPPNQSSSPASKAASLEELKKNLSEFRSRSSVPPPSDLGSTSSSSASSSSWQRGISFQELYKKNAMRKEEDGNAPADSTGGSRSSMAFDSIRESLRLASRNERKSGDPMSLSEYNYSLKLKPSDPSSTPVLGGTSRLPVSVFGKELRNRKNGENEGKKTEFVKTYSHGELGTKLKALRPDKAKGKDWFSLTELNERLMKLRTMEEKETESRIGGVLFQDLKNSLVSIQVSLDEKAKQTSCE